MLPRRSSKGLTLRPPRHRGLIEKEGGSCCRNVGGCAWGLRYCLCPSKHGQKGLVRTVLLRLLALCERERRPLAQEAEVVCPQFRGLDPFLLWKSQLALLVGSLVRWFLILAAG